jgi:hypothetical protein
MGGVMAMAADMIFHGRSMKDSKHASSGADFIEGREYSTRLSPCPVYSEFAGSRITHGL